MYQKFLIPFQWILAKRSIRTNTGWFTMLIQILNLKLKLYQPIHRLTLIKTTCLRTLSRKSITHFRTFAALKIYAWRKLTGVRSRRILLPSPFFWLLHWFTVNPHYRAKYYSKVISYIGKAWRRIHLNTKKHTVIFHYGQMVYSAVCRLTRSPWIQAILLILSTCIKCFPCSF